MVETCLDSALEQLSSLEESPLISERHSLWADQMVDKIQSCKFGLRFLRMFFWSFFTLEDSDVEIRNLLMPVNRTREAIWGISRNELDSTSCLKDAEVEIENWVVDVQGRIQRCKQKFEESCELLLQCSLSRNSLKNKMTLNFLDAILKNVKDLYKYKNDDEILLLENQIATLEKKLILLHNLYNLTPKQWRRFKEAREFKLVVHAFAQYSACLIFLYWVKAVDEDMVAKLNLFLFNVLQKIKPCVPVFKAFYFRFLKEMKLGQLDPFLLEQIVQIFLDLLLENLMDILKDDFQILQESLTFGISFLANPPDQHVEDKEVMMITAEIEVLVKEDLYLVISVDDMKGNFSKPNTCLSDLMRKADLVKGKIQQVY